MTKFSVALVAALGLAVPVASQASGGERDGRNGTYALYWTIGATEIREGEFWIEEQGEIAASRLYPLRLFATQGAVNNAKGKLLLPSGTQMVHVSSDKMLACSHAKTSAGESKKKRVCLIDADGDGSFDNSFTKGFGGTKWIAFDGNLSKEKLQPIDPISLVELEVEEFEDAPYIKMHYQRILDGGLTLPLTQEGGNAVRFHFKVRQPDRKRETWVVRECRAPAKPSFCTSADFPSNMEFGGLDLELLERRGEDIRMRMVKSFDPVPFRFVDTSYSYYTQLTIFGMSAE